jgi:hypothetical protein
MLSTQAELDYLHENRMIKRVDVSSLFQVDAEGRPNDSLIDHDKAEAVVSECRLFSAGSNKPGEMIEIIVRNHLDDVKDTPAGYDYVDAPGSDRVYNEMTRLFASVMRYGYLENAVGLLREDRSASPNYNGYVSKMAFTSPRVELPKSLRQFIDIEDEKRARLWSDVASRPTLSWVSETPRGSTRIEQLYEVVLSRVPTVSQLTSWEDIAAFRSDPDVLLLYHSLHDWVKKLAATETSLAELRDEIDNLLIQNIAHLKRHRIQHRFGLARLIVGFVPDIVEHTLKGRLRQLTDLPFQIFEKSKAFRDARAAAPGRELSYLVEVSERLQR